MLHLSRVISPFPTAQRMRGSKRARFRDKITNYGTYKVNTSQARFHFTVSFDFLSLLLLLMIFSHVIVSIYRIFSTFFTVVSLFVDNPIKFLPLLAVFFYFRSIRYPKFDLSKGVREEEGRQKLLFINRIGNISAGSKQRQLVIEIFFYRNWWHLQWVEWA